MKFAEFVRGFAKASDAERDRLLGQNGEYDVRALAPALKELCVNSWEGDTDLVPLAAEAAEYLAKVEGLPEVRAYADWCGGYSALLRGEMENAIGCLDRAAAEFLQLGNPHTSASAQILKLYPLAYLNRSEEGIELGKALRQTLLLNGDLTAVGKIELNMGNLHWLRDRYPEAETLFRSARRYFSDIRDAKLLTQAENSLAVALTMQNRFREAEEIYRIALPRAEQEQLFGIKAAMESSLGMLALSQGHYDRALDFLERARKGYEELEMPHKLAITEREIADAYLELNLALEASRIYERIATAFASFDSPLEQAHARVNYARALLLTGEKDAARGQLSEAAKLYRQCDSDSGDASVALIEARVELADHNHLAAAAAARRADKGFSNLGMIGRALVARLVEVEALRSKGELDRAFELSASALITAEDSGLPQITWRLHTLQGLIAAAKGRRDPAERSFRSAISIVENLRAPLPAEEFRIAFFSDKLEPYGELAGLCLLDPAGGRVGEALELIELSRARTLHELIGSITDGSRASGLDASPNGQELEGLREELNWFYSRLSRPMSGTDPKQILDLEAEVRVREKAVSELLLKNAGRGDGSTFAGVAPFDLEGLQSDLGADTVFVEYALIADEIVAFLIDGKRLELVRTPADEERISVLLERFFFQIDALRHNPIEMREHLYELTLRTRDCLRELYDLLLRPLEAFIGLRRLVIAPHRVLHYVPFPALHDGLSYAIETRQIVFAPSAASWQACLRKKQHQGRHALLMAVPDEMIPKVMDEVSEIEPLFETSVRLNGGDATLSALDQNASSANILHLACHGYFRPDNPLFSALKLADGRLTARDAAKLDLQNCDLAVLSACETGLNLVAPGDELLGLTRGFFVAGVTSLVLSKWTVDDEATAYLMGRFYRHLAAAESPSDALRTAQLETMKKFPHPYFWASFTLTGRP